MLNSLFTATETLQIEHVVHQNCKQKVPVLKVLGQACDAL